jgi:hypothetical protein
MEDVTYTKGLYTATATVRPLDGGEYRGVVSLARDEGEELEEAKALAHRILGEIEF